MDRVYVVRHAKAGERRHWNSDDIERPLSKKGWRQSNALSKRFKQQPPTALLASPFLRCVQTLEPLGLKFGLTVQITDALAENRPVIAVLDMIRGVADGTVLCSHGDLIPASIKALTQDGMKLADKPDFRKAAMFTLHRNKSGHIVRATVQAPPII